MRKNFLNKILLFSTFIGLGTGITHANLTITEIMQSNIYNVYVDNDFPDSWIELHNNGTEDINLEGYAIGVKDSFENAYKLSDYVLRPGAFVVLYCDKEDNGMHTDFRVDSGKGSVYLFNPDQTIAQEVVLKKMLGPDISIGVDEYGKWGYQLTASPGSENAGGTSDNVLPAPVFSQKGGYISSPINLTITIPEGAPEDAVLCVTTDGSNPTMENAVESPYAISITNTTPVTAKLISETAHSAMPSSNTYVMHHCDTNLPLVCITGNNAYFYSAEMGILSSGKEDAEKPNFMYDWRRPVNVELYIDGESCFNQLGETRVQGGTTRQTNAQKSLAVYANKRFGEKRFNTSKIWIDKPHVKQSKSFILRNSGNDYSYALTRDAYLQSMIGKSTDNLDYQAFRTAVCYINGEYKGVINIRERSNDDWVAANYDELEDIDMWETWNELKAGDENSLKEFKDFLETDFTYQQLDEVFDIDSYLQMMSGFIFAANGDFIGNNNVLWRNQNPENKKWRFLVKDCDFAFGLYGNGPDTDTFNMIDTFMESPEIAGSSYNQVFYKGIAALFKFCFKNPKASELLAERLAFFMGDFFNAENAVKALKEIADEKANEIEPTFYTYHPEAWADRSVKVWKEQNYEYIPNWIEHRAENLLPQMQKYLGLENPYILKINPNGENVEWCDLKLTQPRFDGYWFVGREMRLNGVDGLMWEQNIDFENGEQTRKWYEKGEPVKFTAPEGVKSVSFWLVENSGVDSVEWNESIPSLYYTLEGILLPSRPIDKGIYIEKKGVVSRKIIVR